MPSSSAPRRMSARLTSLAKFLSRSLRLTERGVTSSRLLEGRTRATARMNPESSSTAKRVCSINASRGMPVWSPWVRTARMMSSG